MPNAERGEWINMNQCSTIAKCRTCSEPRSKRSEPAPVAHAKLSFPESHHPTPQNPQNPNKQTQVHQRASQPSHKPSLARPFPFGPGLDPDADTGPDLERLKLPLNSYCLLLPGRPLLAAFPFACASRHSGLQNHFALPLGARSSLTQGRWNHSRGHESLSHATMLPNDTWLQ